MWIIIITSYTILYIYNQMIMFQHDAFLSNHTDDKNVIPNAKAKNVEDEDKYYYRYQALCRGEMLRVR